MNTQIGSRLAAVAVATTVLAGGAAAVAASAKTAETVSDFGSGNGKMTMQVTQSGRTIEAVSFNLTCSAKAYVAATPRVKIARSGAFSYSGAATLFSGAKQKKSKTTIKVNGKIDFTKAHTLSSTKKGTVKASTTADHCSAYSGRLMGFVVPPGT